MCDFAAGDDDTIQAAATWLLKRYGVTSAELSPGQTETLLRPLLDETSWLARLHALQMMESLALPASLAAALMEALEAQARGQNKFLRAWSVHGAAVLADQHPQYRNRALDLLAVAPAGCRPISAGAPSQDLPGFRLDLGAAKSANLAEEIAEDRVAMSKAGDANKMPRPVDAPGDLVGEQRTVR